MNPPTWTPIQQARLLDCLRAGDTLAYYCSGSHGEPINGGSGTVAAPGAIHHPAAHQFRPCTAGAVHGTREPQRWEGSRVWVVALRGQIARVDGAKIASTEREVLGEITASDCIDLRVAVRIGTDLTGADLTETDLREADLRGARLRWADLTEADLTGADLTGADLTGADLSGIDLAGAVLTDAILRGANLRRANLRGANLRGAILRGADLDDADLRGAYYPTGPVPSGWVRNDNGRLERA